MSWTLRDQLTRGYPFEGRLRARPCLNCGEPSIYPLCHKCYASERSRTRRVLRRSPPEELTPSGEWTACTRCGGINGRHFTDCPTTEGENPR